MTGRSNLNLGPEAEVIRLKAEVAILQSQIKLMESELRTARWLNPMPEMLQYETMNWDCRPNHYGGEDVVHHFRTVEGTMFEAHWQTNAPPGPGTIGVMLMLPRA